MTAKINYRELERKYGIPRRALYERIHECHMPVEQAISLPYKPKKKNQFTVAYEPYNVTCSLPLIPNLNNKRGWPW